MSEVNWNSFDGDSISDERRFWWSEGSDASPLYIIWYGDKPQPRNGSSYYIVSRDDEREPQNWSGDPAQADEIVAGPFPSLNSAKEAYLGLIAPAAGVKWEIALRACVTAIVSVVAPDEDSARRLAIKEAEASAQPLAVAGGPDWSEPANIEIDYCEESN